MPPVSTTWNVRPFHSASSEETVARGAGVSSRGETFTDRRLNSVLFPTLGLATSATIGWSFDFRFRFTIGGRVGLKPCVTMRASGPDLCLYYGVTVPVGSGVGVT